MVPYFPDAIQSWDISVLNWIQQNICTPFLNKLAPIISMFGDAGIFWIAVSILFIVFKKTRRTGIMMLLSLTLGLIIGNGITKNIFLRVRPFNMPNALVGSKHLLIDTPTDTSFPSCHTLACFECATVLLVRDWRFGIPALVIAVSVAFSRMYMYVHYPTDILGGIVLAVLVSSLAMFITNKVLSVLEDKKGIHID